VSLFETLTKTERSLMADALEDITYGAYTQSIRRFVGSWGRNTGGRASVMWWGGLTFERRNCFQRTVR
jgi:hypothetical protein